MLGAGVAQNQYAKAYEEFFDNISKHRIKKKVNAKLLFEQNSKKIIQKYPNNYNKFADIKFLPYQEESPVEIFIEKDKAHITIQEKEPTIITINNKTIAQSFQKQFDSLWNQETEKYEGVAGMRVAYLEALEATPKGEMTYVYGASTTSKEADKVFLEYNKKRAEKNVGLQILFNLKAKKSTTTRSAQEKFNPLADIRFIPYTTTPTNFEIFPDRVLLCTASSSKPTTVVLKNKEVVESFKINFSELWKKSKKNKTN